MAVSKNDKGVEIKGILISNASTPGEPTNVNKLKRANEKEEVRKRSVTERNDVLPCSKTQMIIDDTNEQHNLEKKKSLSEQEEAFPEPTGQDAIPEPESTDLGAKSKKDNELGTMIEDLQKFGTGMDIEVKTKKESSKSASKKRKEEKVKLEPPKLTDVNFFSVDVSKPNKKNSKEDKAQGIKVKKEEKRDGSSKDKKKLKKKLSESKLATAKEKSKIQRYKELKKLVKDSEKNIHSVAESSGAKKTEITGETNKLGSDSKKKVGIATNSGKLSASGKSGSPHKATRKISKELDKDSKKICTSESETKDIAGKIERDKELKRSLKKSCIAANPGMVSSDSEQSSGEIKKSNVVESDIDTNVEDDSEENELLRLFNDYDPVNGEPGVMDSMDIHEMNIDMRDKSDNRIQSIPKSIAGIKRPSSESIPVGFKKPRVAHQPSLVSAHVRCTTVHNGIQLSYSHNSSQTINFKP